MLNISIKSVLLLGLQDQALLRCSTGTGIGTVKRKKKPLDFNTISFIKSSRKDARRRATDVNGRSHPPFGLVKLQVGVTTILLELAVVAAAVVAGVVAEVDIS